MMIMMMMMMMMIELTQLVDWNGYEARETPLLYVFVDRLKAFLSF